MELEALTRKTAAAASSTLALSEYLINQKELSERVKGHHTQIRLDVVATHHFSWRSVHNNMLMRCSIALKNLSKTVPPFDKDRKTDLLHANFKGPTLFGGAKLQKAKTEQATSLTVFPNPAVTSTSYST